MGNVAWAFQSAWRHAGDVIGSWPPVAVSGPQPSRGLWVGQTRMKPTSIGDAAGMHSAAAAARCWRTSVLARRHSALDGVRSLDISSWVVRARHEPPCIADRWSSHWHVPRDAGAGLSRDARRRRSRVITTRRCRCVDSQFTPPATTQLDGRVWPFDFVPWPWTNSPLYLRHSCCYYTYSSCLLFFGVDRRHCGSLNTFRTIIRAVWTG